MFTSYTRNPITLSSALAIHTSDLIRSFFWFWFELYEDQINGCNNHQKKLDDLLMRVGLVLPMILIWKAASNDICPFDQRRGVFRFLYNRDLSMEEFTCDPKVYLHENGSSSMLHIGVGNSNDLNNSEGERVVLGKKIVEENHSTEDLRKINPTWVVRSRSNVSDILSEHEECECV